MLYLVVQVCSMWYAACHTCALFYFIYYAGVGVCRCVPVLSHAFPI